MLLSDARTYRNITIECFHFGDNDFVFFFFFVHFRLFAAADAFFFFSFRLFVATIVNGFGNTNIIYAVARVHFGAIEHHLHCILNWVCGACTLALPSNIPLFFAAAPDLNIYICCSFSLLCPMAQQIHTLAPPRCVYNRFWCQRNNPNHCSRTQNLHVLFPASLRMRTQNRANRSSLSTRSVFLWLDSLVIWPNLFFFSPTKHFKLWRIINVAVTSTLTQQTRNGWFLLHNATIFMCYDYGLGMMSACTQCQRLFSSGRNLITSTQLNHSAIELHGSSNSSEFHQLKINQRHWFTAVEHINNYNNLQCRVCIQLRAHKFEIVD